MQAGPRLCGSRCNFSWGSAVRSKGWMSIRSCMNMSIVLGYGCATMRIGSVMYCRSGVSIHYRQAFGDYDSRACAETVRLAAVCARKPLEVEQYAYRLRQSGIYWFGEHDIRPAEANASSRFDCVNIPRQCLENYFWGPKQTVYCRLPQR